MSKLIGHFYDFGPYRVDTLKRLLLREGQPVPLTSKAFETLLALVRGSGEVIEKDELMRAVWPDTIVEENNLTQNVSMLRKALGETSRDHRYIVTVPGRGYSFVASVTETCDEPAEAQPAAAVTPAAATPSPGNSIAEVFPEASPAASMLEAGAQTDVKGAQTSIGSTGEQHDSQSNGHSVAFPTPEQSFPSSSVAPPALASPSLAAVSPPSPSLFSSRRWLALLLLGLVALAPLFWLWSRAGQPEAKSATPTPGSIAVLPFKPLGMEAGDEYLGVGMADALITKLSNLRQISVRPTSAVIKYTGQATDPLVAGRELSVDAVLSGVIQRVEGRLRVTVQLFSVRERRVLRAYSFDVQPTDFITLEDSISARVAEALPLELTGEEKTLLAKRYTENVEAYQSYQRGRYFWNKRNAEAMRLAIECFEQAIERDHNYALAYAGLADVYSVMGFYQFGALTPAENFQRGKGAALYALAIDDTLAEAHASLAIALGDVDQDAAGAEREYRRAIELNPSYATAHHWYSDHLASLNRQPEAMEEIRRALELDPTSLVINATLGERLYYARLYDESIAQLRKTLQMDSGFVPAHYLLGLALEQKGDYDGAIAELRQALADSGNPWMIAALGHAYAVAGRSDEAQRVLDELSKNERASGFDLAMVYVGLGQKENAAAALKKFLKARPRQPLDADPRMDALRHDPKYRRLWSS